jgi:enterochelin esterase family protein
MGGLMAFYCGLRMPEIFGNVLSQSGSLYQGFVVDTLINQGIGKQTRIWMDVGQFEYLLNINRQVHETLVGKGYSVSYQEFNGGHNYTAWRDDLISGLEIMFGL